MSRQVFDIKDFKYGVISSIDEEDIPSESASDSLNVDGDSAEGILRGIPSDTQYLIDSDADAAADDALVDVRLGEFIEDNGTYYFIYHDSNANTISIIKDFYGAVPIKETLLSSVPDTVTMTTNNKEVHISYGTGAKWIGKITHKQFGLTDITSLFEGTGLDDATGTVSGYTGIKLVIFDVEITATGANDTFKWRKDGGSYTTGVSIANTSAITLSNGVTITFAATTGHTIGDKWHITTEGIYITDASIVTAESVSSPIYIATAAETTGTGEKYFIATNTYRWACSYIFDGYQESPLILWDSISDAPSVDSEYYVLTLRAAGAVNGSAIFNRRITGVNIYRVEYATTGTAEQRGLYRLIATIDINDSDWATVTTSRDIIIRDYGITSQIANGATPYTVTADSINYGGTTYDENAGISETIIDSMVYYKLSIKGNGYHFVGKCTKSGVVDAERYIFRSKYLRYDMFNWTDDFLIMPEPITAMHFYDGKLFVFSLNKTYRINPDGLYIEDVFDDAGCQGQRAVHSNEYGMFFGNAFNAWMYQSGQFIPIGDAIRQSASGGKSWQTFLFSTLTDLIVTSDSKKGYVLFINERTDTTAKLFAWAYSPSKKRWDAFAFGGYASSANAGAFKGKNGEVYLSNASATYNLMRPSISTYTQAWEWYSQELSFGETRQVKSISMIKVDATGTVGITYGVDGALPTTSGTSEALINVYNKSIRIKLNGAAVSSGSTYTNYADSLELIYRPLVGKR